MSEEAVFFRQAAEAIVATSLNSANVDPTIRELLSRIKYVNPNLSQGQGPGQLQAQAQVHTQTNQDRVTSREKSQDLAASSNEKNVVEYFTNPLNLSIADNGSSQVPGIMDYRSSSSSPPARKRKLLDFENDQEDTNASFTNAQTNGDDDKSLDDKKFSCAKCKLEFRRTSDLRRHERIHLPVLPNICSQCGKGFARKDALKRHFNTLTCRRNRSKLLTIGGDISEILEKAQQTGNGGT